MSSVTIERAGESFPSTVTENREGMWGEMTSQEGLRQVVFRRPLPMQMIRTYAELAVDHAQLEETDDGEWLGTIATFAGVWAKESSQRRTLEVLEEVVFEWVLLKIRDEDRDLPVLDSIDLNTL